MCPVHEQHLVQMKHDTTDGDLCEQSKEVMRSRVDNMQTLINDMEKLAQIWGVRIPGSWTTSAQEVLDEVKGRYAKKD